MKKRKLGKSGIEVSAMGLGCWAIGGGEMFPGIDDSESVRALHAAIEMGVGLLDTCEGYGPESHSETIIGKAIRGRRDNVVLCTKFKPYQKTESDIRKALEGSLNRLGTDYLDLYLCREGGYTPEQRDIYNTTLQALQEEGKIRAYGISSDALPSIEHQVKHASPVVCEIPFSIIKRSDEALAFAETHGLAAMNKSPLGMGMLTGKFNKDTIFVKGDLRGRTGPGFEWLSEYFDNGKPRPDFLTKLEAIREILTSKNRTLLQGALAWLWGRSPVNIPIPGFKNTRQVTENCGALEFGPLLLEQMDEIEKIFNISQ